MTIEALIDELEGLEPGEQARLLSVLEPDELATIEEAFRTRRHRDDPVLWAKERLDEFFWSKQREICRSVVANRYTAVHAAHDVSKSHTASRIACWWIDQHPPHEAFVVSSAPVFQQVRGILWREIKQAHRKGNLPGRVNQTDWLIDEQLVAFGRKPSDYDVAAFQGIHARYVLVILDEAAGIPRSLFDAADALVTNEDSRLLVVGNPDDVSSHFAEVCKPGSGWNVIHIDGLESPNFTDEEIPEELRPLLLSPTWVQERKERWGEESPLYISKVRGLFPDNALDGVVPLNWVRQCQIDDPEPSDYVELGLDVGASTDGDETVIFERRGNAAGRSWKIRTDQPEEIVGQAVARINETNARAVKIDTIGVGFGIAGWLETKFKEGVHKARVIRVNVAKQSRDPKRFPNLRSQLWWEIGRELSETQGWNLKNLDDDTVAQLIAPKYSTDSSGRTVVEKKSDTRERLNRSPDEADALLLAFYSPVRQARTSSAARTEMPRTPISTR